LAAKHQTDITREVSDCGKKSAVGAPDLLVIEVDGKDMQLPVAAFVAGASVLNLARGPMEPYTGTAWYRDSIQAFFAALKDLGLSRVEF
jgi:hypothetical protein